MKAHAPIYVKESVWESCSSDVSNRRSDNEAVWPGASAVALTPAGGTQHSQAQPPEQLSGSKLLTTLMCAQFGGADRRIVHRTMDIGVGLKKGFLHCTFVFGEVKGGGNNHN